MLLGAAALLIGLIAGGVFDPQPIGAEQWRQALAPRTVPAAARQIHWLDVPLPENDYTVRLTAAYQSGELDSAYGLALGSDAEYLSIELSPLGYVTLHPSPLLPWQPWPHVRPGTAANEIWLDVTDGHLTARLNRELLWSGEIGPVHGRIGLVAESFGEAAVIDFQMLELFAATASKPPVAERP